MHALNITSLWNFYQNVENEDSVAEIDTNSIFKILWLGRLLALSSSIICVFYLKAHFVIIQTPFSRCMYAHNKLISKFSVDRFRCYELCMICFIILLCYDFVGISNLFYVDIQFIQIWQLFHQANKSTQNIFHTNIHVLTKGFYWCKNLVVWRKMGH